MAHIGAEWKSIKTLGDGDHRKITVTLANLLKTFQHVVADLGGLWVLRTDGGMGRSKLAQESGDPGVLLRQVYCRLYEARFGIHIQSVFEGYAQLCEESITK